MSRLLIHIDATAGWGKTTAIERDVKKYADISSFWRAEHALYLVFTKRNRESARRRLKGYVKADNIRTFHSLCYSFLPEKRPVMDGKLLKRFARECGYKNLSSGMFFTPRSEGDRLLALYYYARNREMRMDEVSENLCSKHGVRREKFFSFWLEWERFKKEHGAVDYADILELSEPSFGGIYLAVDEAQDFTPLMWKTFEKLIENSPSLRRVVIVGDCDQTVYEFQGSDPVYFLNYPEVLARRYGFEYVKWNTGNVSRRVPSKPLEFALRFLKPVRYRDHEKEILPAREGGEVLLMRREDFLRFAFEQYLKGRVIVVQERHRHELSWWKKMFLARRIPYCTNSDDYLKKFRAWKNLLEGKDPHLNLYTVFGDDLLSYLPYRDYLSDWERYYGVFLRNKERWIERVRDENLRNFLSSPWGGYAVLTTMHSQKGEEGDVVWVSGKWTKKVKPDDEERKLYFTACTRTRDILVIDSDYYSNIRSLWK